MIIKTIVIILMIIAMIIQILVGLEKLNTTFYLLEIASLWLSITGIFLDRLINE